MNCTETFFMDGGGHMEWKGIPQSMNTWNKRVTMLSSTRSNRLNCMVVINLSNSIVMGSWNRPTD